MLRTEQSTGQSRSTSFRLLDPCGMTTGMGFEAERTRDLAVDDRNLVRPGTDFSILRQKRDPPRRVTRD